MRSTLLVCVTGLTLIANLLAGCGSGCGGVCCGPVVSAPCGDALPETGGDATAQSDTPVVAVDANDADDAPVAIDATDATDATDAPVATDATEAGLCTTDTRGCACQTTADCAPTPSNTVICSFTTAGCGMQGTCVQQRLCADNQTFCGCDGQTYHTEVCYQGIPAPWVHAGACETDAGTDAPAAD